MKALFVRKEKSNGVRSALLSSEMEFFEETDGFHSLFILPEAPPNKKLEGKWCYVVDGNIDEIDIEGKSFRIEGNREAIDKFAPKFEGRELKVKLEAPDLVLEIKKWNRKYLISVSSVSH